MHQNDWESEADCLPLTKNSLCRAIAGSYELDAGRPVGDFDVSQSSQLAVAMLHLGKIKDERLQEYARTRGGAETNTWT